MKNNYLEKYLKYKEKYLQSRNLNKNGGGFLTEDNSINSMICNIILSDTVVPEPKPKPLFILVSFKNGFIYNYYEEKCYLILKKAKDEFYLFGIRNIDSSITELEEINKKGEQFNEEYQKQNIQILKRDPNVVEQSKPPIDDKKKIERKWVIKNFEDNNKLYTINNLELKPYAHNLCNKKLVVFVRHGESEANKSENFTIHPNPLSNLGVAQCEALSIDLLNFNKYLGSKSNMLKSLDNCIRYAIYSPLQRASETGEIGLSKIIDENSTVLKKKIKIKKKEEEEEEEVEVEEEEEENIKGITVKITNRENTSIDENDKQLQKMTIIYPSEKKNTLKKELKFLCTEIIGSYSDVGRDKENYKELFPAVEVVDTDFDHGYNLLWNNYHSKSYDEDRGNLLNNDVILEKYRPHMIHKDLLSNENKIITVFTHSNFISNYLEYVLDIPSVFGKDDLSIKSNDDEIHFDAKFKEFYPFIIRNTNIILFLIDHEE